MKDSVMVTDPSHLPVHIIQCGTEQELSVIEYLKNLVSSCKNLANKLDLQHTTYRDDQEHNRSRIVQMDVEKHKKNNDFVIIFVCKTLFEVIWSTPQKRTFLKMISTMRNCLHIWIDVNEEDVKRKSTILLRKDLNFGRIHIDELTRGSLRDSDAKISLINTLLHTSATKFSSLNNYAVDDEIDDMKERFFTASYADRKIKGELENSSVNTDLKNLHLNDNVDKSGRPPSRTRPGPYLSQSGRIGSTR